jgi:hypothetical protein
VVAFVLVAFQMDNGMLRRQDADSIHGCDRGSHHSIFAMLNVSPRAIIKTVLVNAAYAGQVFR